MKSDKTTHQQQKRILIIEDYFANNQVPKRLSSIFQEFEITIFNPQDHLMTIQHDLHQLVNQFAPDLIIAYRYGAIPAGCLSGYKRIFIFPRFICDELFRNQLAAEISDVSQLEMYYTEYCRLASKQFLTITSFDRENTYAFCLLSGKDAREYEIYHAYYVEAMGFDTDMSDAIMGTDRFIEKSEINLLFRCLRNLICDII